MHEASTCILRTALKTKQAPHRGPYKGGGKGSCIHTYAYRLHQIIECLAPLSIQVMACICYFMRSKIRPGPQLLDPLAGGTVVKPGLGSSEQRDADRLMKMANSFHEGSLGPRIQILYVVVANLTAGGENGTDVITVYVRWSLQACQQAKIYTSK